jgi:hypothetical protein
MNMSASPPKDLEAEVGEQEQSPDEQEHMERGQQEASQQQPVFDFEVKEQDRWLPIANGKAFFPSLMPTLAFPSFSLPIIFPALFRVPGCSTLAGPYQLFILFYFFAMCFDNRTTCLEDFHWTRCLNAGRCRSKHIASLSPPRISGLRARYTDQL